MKKEKSGGAVKTVGVMMLITLAGKVLGLLRDRMFTVRYGSGVTANAFLTASRAPRVFFDTLFASAISASFIPIYSEALEKKGRDEANRFAGNFITVTALLCALLSALGILFAEQLTAFFADGYDGETAALCAKLTRIMMPTTIFTGVAFSFVGVLQTLGEFNIPAAISLVSNGLIIVYYAALNRRFGVTGLAVAFLIAWLLQALVQIPSLKKRGFRFRPSLSFRTEEMKKVFALMLPVMVSMWVLPLNQMISAKFGSRLFNGAGVSAVELSYNLYTVIAGVFVLSLTNYIFPRLSRQNAAEDLTGLRATVSGSLHTCLFVVLPMTAGLFVMARPLVSFLYGGGEFDAFSVGITARALRFMSLGMVGYGIQAVLCRVYFAARDGKTPLIAGAAAIILNLLLCMVLTPRLDVAGIALASALAFFANGILLAVPLKKRGLGCFDRAFLRDLLKMIVSALLTAGAAALVLHFTEGRGKLLALLLPTAAGAAVFAAAAFALRLPETDYVRDKLRSVKHG